MFFPDDDDNNNNDSSLTTPLLLSSTPTSTTTTTNNNNRTTMEYHEIDHQESAPLVANSGDNNNTGTTDIGPSNDHSSIVAIDAVDTWRQRLIRYQRNCIMISYVLSLFCLLVVISWIHHLGGLSLKKNLQSKQVFNWHPLLMTTSFVFMTVSALAFRQYDRPKSKTIHGLGWTAAILCMCIGLIAVFQSHNDNTGYIANMYSLHSWVGLMVLLLYTVQFVSAVLSFGWPTTRVPIPMIVSEGFKSNLLLVHRYFGPMIYIGMMCTILLGIQEKEGFVGCAYKVDKFDAFPPIHFYEIPLPCRISHLLGLLVFATGICTSFVLHPIDRGSYRQN
jgi:hypothetical protein